MNPFSLDDPVPGLAALRELVRRDDDLDPRIRLWLSHGLRAYVDGQAESLDAALGLPNPAARARARRAERRVDLLHTALLISPGGTLTHRLRRVSELLTGARSEPGEEGLRLFLAAHRHELPRSCRSLWKIVPPITLPY